MSPCLISDVRHDVNNSLMAILGYVELMRCGPTSRPTW